ncbi:hypothetical protein CLOSCI_00564 [[Clostridium] scindens ATCC 35704]|uniref:Uncharacterized protein n=1 Tax=Clostridium scindens (strain ATCC 35704 / DSM 5676 / VPI 13733 / 19) TaxID=411468 RepID=B0NAU5_CLOS5|nr:hypothetical protein [[Clostridium] scindens]EDS08253.1 hypothetical protein CLOSCI_00564 [[Clostridium] scindens ATCC 35704]QBF75567.1 hypothetical protein HDCHBGLK_02978 [[Clostridium] scindens ATCC 35704]QRO38684.1 hypothetical protein I6J57_08665 [[Clostridium] scindens]
MRRRKEDRRRENNLAILLLIPVSLLMAAFIIFAVADDWKQQDAAAREQQETKEPEPLTIETPDPCDTGSIVIYANGGVYAFYGTFDIKNDGRDGEEIIMTLEGYMEAEYPHGVPEVKETYGP